MLRILIADDHSVVRKGLRQILTEEFHYVEIGEAINAEETFAMLSREEWNIVISDISMPDKNGLEVLQHIRQYYSHIKVLVLSIYPEDQYALRVLQAGASGYVSKDAASEELITAIQCLLMGKKYISPYTSQKLADITSHDNKRPTHEYLSDREFEVMKLLAAGNTVSEIAVNLALSVNTISTYKARILSKMNMTRNAELTLYAMENKLI